MASPRLVIIAPLLLLAFPGCGPAPSIDVPSSGTPVAAAPTPSAGAPPAAGEGASPAAEASAPPPPAPAPSLALSEPVCPLFADLFASGRRFSYVVVDDVDSHGPPEPGDDSLVVGSSTITCRVGALDVEGDIVRAPFDCVGGDGSEVGVLDIEGFRLRRRALADGVDGDVADSAWLSCDPKAGTTQVDAEASFGGPDRCTVEVRKDVAHGLCRTERCPHGGYGNAPSVHQVCFAAGRGLTRKLTENLNGPRITEWVLAKP